MTTGRPATPTAERQRLMASCQGLVRSIAWKVHQRLPAHVDLEDLVSYGQVGLAEAARDFDADRGGQFTTFAWYRVRGAILDGLSRMRWFNRGDFEGGRYERMANEALADADAGVDPTRGDPGRIVAREGAWLKGASSALAVACLGTWAGGGADGEIVDDEGERPDEILIRREVAARLRQLVDALPSDMATLVRATYFQGRTLTDAAAEVGISKAWASRLHARALGRLAESLQQAGLD
jgi:RNA polymerase sigma factor for flagellar operon FliA